MPGSVPDVRYWKKGDQAPDKNVPYRHQRDKALLLLDGMSGEAEQMYAVLRHLVETDARPVLDALCAVMDADVTP